MMLVERQWLGGCEQLAARYGVTAECCSSCHFDDEDGYYDIGDWDADDGWYSCCCSMRYKLYGLGKREWEKPWRSWNGCDNATGWNEAQDPGFARWSALVREQDGGE